MLRKIAIPTHLRHKLVIAFLLVMLIPMALIALYGYFFTSRVLSEQALERSTHEVQLQAEHIVRSLAQAQGDTLYLAELRSLARLRELLTENGDSGAIRTWRDEAEQDFIALLSARTMYRSLRYFNKVGQEVVRVEFSQRVVRAVPPDELVDRSRYAYFRMPASLPPGSTYVSSFAVDSNDESAAPVVHYAMNLPEGDGVVMVDIHAGWILRNLPSGSPDRWALIDQDGEYLVYPKDYQPQTLETDGAHRIENELASLLNGGQGILDTPNNVYAFYTIYPTSSSGDQYWVLYRDTPRDVFYADVVDFFLKAGLFIGLGLVTAVLMAIYISRSITRPVIELEREAAQFGRGGPAPELPGGLPDDEIGRLTRTFVEMAQELERKRREARNLIERLITAQEEERKLVAYDLHDGLIQQMVGARLYLTNFRQSCPDGDPESNESFVQGYKALTQAIGDGRRIIEGLRPAALDDLGLRDAIAELAQATAQAAGWELELQLQPLPVEPEKSISVTLYRIAQEALNNALKHSGARRVQLHLANGNGLSLSVQDNGKGFEPVTVGAEAKGLGITTMHERAELLNGTCSITSSTTSGTTVSVWIPWQPDRGDGQTDTSGDTANE